MSEVNFLWRLAGSVYAIVSKSPCCQRRSGPARVSWERRSLVSARGRLNPYTSHPLLHHGTSNQTQGSYPHPVA